ncbi:OSBP family protein [Sporobolomyces salmoneus]|uniref:OSBP family protein n=1 Tax=Sporobolomyces salmoneus TaxID=183962 RepID=UPI003175B96E
MGLSSIVSKASAVVGGSGGSPSSHNNTSPQSAPSMSNATSQDKAPEGASADDTEVLDDEPKNMLLALIGQLRVGMDLSKITLPVFVLEPRSMLERVTDFHSHPELLHGAASLPVEERFITVLRYYLAGWHIKPKGVKKPYNPVLGEFFRCRYDYPDGTVAYYVSEQVSHHPPISAWYFSSPENGLDLCGELKPKSKFLGNSAATIMEGESHLRFLDGEAVKDGEYDITMPNMYARGILFGKMVLELGDSSIVRNHQTGMTCDVEFKTKGFFSGSYNSIAGKIKSPKGDVGEISGHWSDLMEITRKSTKTKEVLFDAHNTSVTEKSVTPEAQQQPNESRRLWSKVTQAIKQNDIDAATEAKTEIEDAQRESARLREEKGEKFVPKYFQLSEKGEWRPAFTLPQGEKSAQREAVRSFVYGSDPEPPSSVGAATTTSTAPPTSTTTAPPPAV